MSQQPMGVLSLFSGIGGIDLGLERTGGFRTVAFCERDEFARRVLAKNWPGVPCYDDVCTLNARRLASDGIGSVQVIAGGFPCQDLSYAGAGAGLAGERSGLWYEMLRLVAEIRPAWVFAENVAALRARGLDEVLRGLSEVGYDAEWHCVPASAVGAPHRRDRIWIVAYPHGARELQQAPAGGQERLRPGHGNAAAAHAVRPRLALWERARLERPFATATGSRWWATEPPVCRVDDGFPGRVDRLRTLGNAVVPHVAEWLGRAMLSMTEAAA